MLLSTTHDDVRPRPEARPLEWEPLTSDQKDAALRTISLLRAIAEKKSGKPLPDKPSGLDLFLPPIDAERVNHVVLLDGGRGSGKTALLVTILDALAWNLRNDDGDADGDARQEAIQKALNLRGQLIVPVGLVDLQPLSRSTNLLLYIVGRFQRVVEAIEQATGHEGARAPWNAVGDDEPKCTKRWRDFLRGAAVGWDGNLSGRRANLDPEAYALEVDQAERQRLDLVTSFRRFVDALVEDWSKLRPRSKGKSPLFVLSIDDADMNPARSVELLDLVRSLWHPRVVFLLTGDSKLFTEALRAHVLGALREPLKGLAGITGEIRRSFDLKMHDRLSSEIYDKVIPAEHRLSLLLLNEDARYRFVKEVLQNQAEGTPSHLRALAIKELFEDYHQLRAALPGRLRDLLSFQSWLRSMLVQETGDSTPIALVLQHLWELTSTSSEILHAVAERLKMWMVWRKNGVRTRIDGEVALELEPATTQIYPLPRGGRIHIGRGINVRITLAKKEQLPDGVVGVLLAVFDLGRVGKLAVENASFPSTKWGELCSMEMYGAAHVFRFGWALPPWQEFRRYIKLAERWTTIVETIGTVGRDVVYLAKRYMLAILDQFGVSLEAEIAWEALARKVAELAVPSQATGTHEPALETWARSLASLLAAPEGGLPAEAANAWLEEFRAVIENARQWDDIKKELVQARRENLRKALDTIRIGTPEKEIEHIIREFDIRSLDHIWRGIVEVDPEKLINRLAARLSEIVVPSSRSHSLMDYISVHRIEELRAAPPALLDQLQASIREFAKKPGQPGALAIDRMWKVATVGQPDEIKQLIQMADPGSLRVALEVARKYFGMPDLASAPFFSSRPGQPPKELRTQIGLTQLVWPGNEAQPWLRALYKIAVDLVADASQQPLALLPPWWNAAGGDPRTWRVRSVLWPAAAWPAFIDWERLIDGWNRAVVPEGQRTAKLAVHAESSVDAAAYWFVRATMHIAHHRCDLTDVPFEAGFLSSRWTEEIQLQQEQIDHQWGPKRDAHRRAFFEWFQAIGLFAAPESGLSVAAANAILDGISDLPQKIPHLMKLRRERLRQPDLDDTAIERMIVTFNERFPNHPWVERVEKLHAASQTPA